MAGVVDTHDLHDFTQGALLHDVGKSRVPRELITKPGAYSEHELRLMRTHVVRGEHILRRDGRLSPVALIPVSQHHERMDGGGYPRAIAAGDLHLLGRIASICDVSDALTSHRSDKQAMTDARSSGPCGVRPACHRRALRERRRLSSGPLTRLNQRPRRAVRTRCS